MDMVNTRVNTRTVLWGIMALGADAYKHWGPDDVVNLVVCGTKVTAAGNQPIWIKFSAGQSLHEIQ